MNDKWNDRFTGFFRGGYNAITAFYVVALLTFQWTKRFPIELMVPIIAGAVLWLGIYLLLRIKAVLIALEERAEKSRKFMENHTEWRMSVEQRLLELSLCDEEERELMELHGLADEEEDDEP